MTSGPSERTKGVALEHSQAGSFLTGMQQQVAFEKDDMVMSKTYLSFDASVCQLIWWTIAGVSFHLITSGRAKDPALMVNALRESGVIPAHLIPSMLNSFLDVLLLIPDDSSSPL
ncbi:AMP-binding protein [Bacillus mojavensis]|nr:AMP-binding protein [Bacillus mojavensis]